MECIFCGEDIARDDIGNDMDKKAVIVGRKLVCMNCLRSLGILLRRIEIEARTRKL